MKIINKVTGGTVAEIVTNRSMSMDEVISLMDWMIDDCGQVYSSEINDYITPAVYWDDLEMIY